MARRRLKYHQKIIEEQHRKAKSAGIIFILSIIMAKKKAKKRLKSNIEKSATIFHQAAGPGGIFENDHIEISASALASTSMCRNLMASCSASTKRNRS